MAWKQEGGKLIWDGAVKLWDEVSDLASDYSRKFFDEHDPRFDDRKREQQRMRDLNVQANHYLRDIPEVKLSDYEGRPYLSSMADRTAAGERIYGVNNVKLKRPVFARGGQDYGFDPINEPGSVWASAEQPVDQIMGLANYLKDRWGVDPVYMPWRMAPTGGDFAATSGDLMMAYASANMDKAAKADFNKAIKEFIPGFKGVDNPESVMQFRQLEDKKRKALMGKLDVGFRNRGGLGIGEARLAASDPYQIGRRDYELQNVGVIDTSRDKGLSTHPWYPFKVPGEALGRLPSDGAPLVTELMDKSATRWVGVDDRPNPWEGAPQDFIGAPEFIYNKQAKRMVPRPGKTGKGVKVNEFVTDDWRKNWRGNTDASNPDATDMRGQMMKPYGGIIDEPLLRRLQDKGYNVGAMTGAGLLGLGAAGASDDTEASFVGQMAKNVDLDMLKRAADMEKAGTGRDDIWKQTLWGRGADGKWRTEIDDSGAVFDPIYDGKRAGTMGEALEHDALFDAYPELRRAEYGDLESDRISERGSYRKRGETAPFGRVRVNENLDPAQQRSTALHELGGHGVADIEGFAPGGSPDLFQADQLPYHNAQSIAEEIADVIQTDAGKKWTAIYTDPVLNEDEKYKRIMALRKEHPDDWQLLGELMEETNVDNPVDLKSYGSKMLDEADRLDPFKQYERMPGEVEARNVQTRLDWPMDARREIPPWESADYTWDEGANVPETALPERLRAAEAQELMFPTPKQNFQKGVNTDGRYHFNQAQPSELWNKVGAAALALPDKPMQGLFGLYGLATGGVDEGARLARMPLWESSEELSEKLRNLNSNSPFVNAGAEGLKWFSRLASPLPF